MNRVDSSMDVIARMQYYQHRTQRHRPIQSNQLWCDRGKASTALGTELCHTYVCRNDSLRYQYQYDNAHDNRTSNFLLIIRRACRFAHRKNHKRAKNKENPNSVPSGTVKLRHESVHKCQHTAVNMPRVIDRST